jgi:predicted transcriptional regulator
MSSRVFRPGSRGLAAAFGPLEACVMETVWAAGAPIAVSDVMATLSRRKKPLAYSTIKTILTNLADKGYLTKRADGRANVFAAVQSRADFERDLVGGVVGSLMRDYRNPLLAHLANELAEDPQSIAEFERLLARRKKRQPPDA